jgi:hypothetical protein
VSIQAAKAAQAIVDRRKFRTLWNLVLSVKSGNLVSAEREVEGRPNAWD